MATTAEEKERHVQRVLELYREAFNLFDKDNSGTISADELGQVMRAMGGNPTEEEINEFVNEIDENKNGEIDFEEFVLLLSNRDGAALHTHDSKADLQRAFDVFDQNGDGKISRTELKTILVSLGESISEKEIEYMFEAADADGDGFIDIGEFTNLLMSN